MGLIDLYAKERISSIDVL